MKSLWLGVTILAKFRGHGIYLNVITSASTGEVIGLYWGESWTKMA